MLLTGFKTTDSKGGKKTTDIFKCKAILLPRLASFSYQNSFTNVTSSMFNAFPIDNDTDINREI